MRDFLRKLPPMSSLRPFEAAARHENFTLAAEELFVTQAAVSKHIRVLENHLGVALFTRNGRNLELTAAGRDLRCAGYGELARRVGRPGAYRAVGTANGANPISIVLPCHRVIGKDGSEKLERPAFRVRRGSPPFNSNVTSAPSGSLRVMS